MNKQEAHQTDIFMFSENNASKYVNESGLEHECECSDCNCCDGDCTDD